MGPHVEKALEPYHELLITDVVPIETKHESRQVDSASLSQVMKAAEGVDTIVNLSVLRHDRQLAFDVNTRGCYNVMRAALEHGIRRVINTGPHFSIQGKPYTTFDFEIHPDVPAQTTTDLYPITKGLGQEICKTFTENYDLYVLTLLFLTFRNHDDKTEGGDLRGFTTSWRDAGEAFRLALAVDLETLPSRCEVFNIFGDFPHRQYSNEKAKRILGFLPRDNFEKIWHKRK